MFVTSPGDGPVHGRVRRPKKEKVNMKYAIVQSGGKQYRAVEGSMIEVDRLDLEPGKEYALEEVLLIADEGNVSVGAPLVKGFKIKTTVVDHIRGPKIRVFHYRNKQRYRKTQGHRQNYTRLMVDKISSGKKEA
jgi:large subunit ribosomal protein L21